MPAHRSLILCADDFAESEEVSLAILQLAEAGSLSAVSCFTDAPLWPELGPKLVALGDRVLIGLHFNLTQDFGHGERGLKQRIVASLTRSLDLGRVRDACRRQLESFETVAGRRPDFIDGHEHVHAFPGVREVVAGLAAERGDPEPIPLRAVTRFFGRTDAPFKRRVIRFLATTGAKRTAGRRTPEGRGPADRTRPGDKGGPGDGLRTTGGGSAARAFNTGFAGDYSLRADADYAALFADWLRAAPDGGLIMCHPRLGDGTPSAGENEYLFLRSRAPTGLFERAGIHLTRPANDSAPAIRLTPRDAAPAG